MRRVLATLVCSTVIALARGASADDAGALVVYNEALELMEARRFDEACPRFEASFRMAPTSRAKMAFALCHERAGHVATAWAAYREAARLARQANDEVSRDAAQTRAAALEPRMPRLVIRGGREPGVAVHLDDALRPPATLEQVLPVDPGRHVVRAVREGRPPFERALTVAEGELATVEIPPLEAARVDLRPAPPESSPGRSLGLVLLGIGAAGLVTSGVTGLMVIDRGDARADVCSPACRSEDERQRALSLNDEGRTLSVVSTVAFVAGAALALAGVYAALTRRSGSRNAITQRPRAQRTPL